MIEIKSEAAERGLLSIIINNPQRILEVIDRLSPQDFFAKNNQVLYDILCQLYVSGISITPVSILTACKNLNLLGLFGDEYIKIIASIEEDPVNLNFYFLKILQCSTRRKLISMLTSHLKKIERDEESGPEDIISALESDITELRVPSSIDLVELRSDYIQEKLVDASANISGITGLRLPWPSLEQITLGLQRGHVYLLCAPTGKGKSVFSTNLASDVGQYGYKVLYIDTEMNKVEWMWRVLSHLSGVPEQHIKTGIYASNDANVKKINQAMQYIDKISLTHVLVPSFTPGIIRSIVKKHSLQIGTDLVIFDYVRAPTEGVEQGWQRLADFIGFLKDVSAEYNVATWATAQLRRPQPGEKVGDAAVAGSYNMLHQVAMTMYLTPKSKAEIASRPHLGNYSLYIDKHRFGESDRTINFDFRRDIVTFCEI